MRTRPLAVYLVLVVAWQITVYTAGFWCLGLFIWYFDPRIGFTIYDPSLEHLRLWGVMAWGSAIVLGALAAGMFLTEKTVWAYVILEPLLALPTILFFATVIRDHISPAHGFSMGELPIPILTFMCCSVVPWVWALCLLATRRSRAAVQG
jgi:hypothetical protein